jgi:hypothetical protein
MIETLRRRWRGLAARQGGNGGAADGQRTDENKN